MRTITVGTGLEGKVSRGPLRFARLAGAVALGALLLLLAGCPSPTGSVAPPADGDGGSGGSGDGTGGSTSRVATPVISPAVEDQFLTVDVFITVETEAATIHFTTDGSAPTADSAVYESPFLLEVGAHTVRAIAVAPDLDASEEASRSYTVADGVLVTSAADSGPGSLRQAMADADPGDEIRFAEDMTIVLEGDRRGIEVDKDIIVDGVGRSIAIETSGAQRHFTHMPGDTYELTLRNLTLRNGEPRHNDTAALLPGGSIYIGMGSTATIENVVFADNLGTNGGAIFVEKSTIGNSTLTISGSTFSDNESRGASDGALGSGGAVFAENAHIAVSDSTFENNRATDGHDVDRPSRSGGAILIAAGTTEKSTAVIRDSVFRNNEADRSGGAIMARNSDLDVVGSTFEGNLVGAPGTTLQDGQGAGAAITGWAGTPEFETVTRIGRTRFLRNRAEGPNNALGGGFPFRGGAVASSNSDLEIYASEFLGNYVGDTGREGDGDTDLAHSGAAVYQSRGDLVIASSTFVGNVSDGTGSSYPRSAVVSDADTDNTDILFSTFASNQGQEGASHYDVDGTLLLSSTIFDNDDFALPGSAASLTFRYNLAPNAQIGAGTDWDDNNINSVPNLAMGVVPGDDGVWGTADDYYGVLVPFAGTAANGAGNATDLPADTLDLDGDGNTAEPLPVDAAGLTRMVGAIDIGARERQ